MFFLASDKSFKYFIGMKIITFYVIFNLHVGIVCAYVRWKRMHKNKIEWMKEKKINIKLNMNKMNIKTHIINYEISEQKKKSSFRCHFISSRFTCTISVSNRLCFFLLICIGTLFDRKKKKKTKYIQSESFSSSSFRSTIKLSIYNNYSDKWAAVRALFFLNFFFSFFWLSVMWIKGKKSKKQKH